VSVMKSIQTPVQAECLYAYHDPLIPDEENQRLGTIHLGSE